MRNGPDKIREVEPIADGFRSAAGY